MTTRYAWASRTGWLALALLIGLAPTLASAAVFNPSPATADGAPGSLRDAISQANANGEDDTINLAAGTYSLTLAGSGEDGNASGDLDLTEAGWTITFSGAGANQTFIDQDTADRVLQIFAGVTVVFQDLTITGGDVSTSGGGIMNAGDATLNNTTVRDNIARGAAATDGGGGIYNDGGTVTLVNRSGVRNNRASGASGSGGGVFTYGGTFSADGARIAGNRANRAGGGIEGAPGPVMRSNKGGIAFAITLTNTDLNNNVAGPTGSANPGNGGGLHITGDMDVQIVGGTVRNNFAAREGGGLWNGAGTMDLDDVNIGPNEAAGPAADDGGGGVFNNGGLVDIDGGKISGNRATGTLGSGGGIHNRGFLEVTGTMISDNTANRAGGGIEDVGDALMTLGTSRGILFTTTLDGVTLSGNNGGANPGNGGGLHSGGGNVAVGGSTVTMNTAVEGGGLWSNGFLDVENTSVSDNVATGNIATKGGGGVFNSGGTVEIEGGSIAGNTASVGSGSGGGVFHLGGTTTISGTTISGNDAARAGGGLEAAVGGTVSLNDVDFTSNTTGGGNGPGNGGALHVTAGTVDATGGNVSGNVAASEGGGFWNNAGWTMTVTGTTFDGNDAQGDAADNGGGGLFNNGGTLIVMGATVSNNTASGTSGSGGGLFNFGGRLEIADTEIAGNTANRAGGGIEDTGAPMTRGGFVPGTYITDTTVSGNDAGTNPGNGGGVHSGGGFVNFSSGEVSGNTAVEGGGLWTSGEMEVGDGGVIIVFPDLTDPSRSGDAFKGGGPSGAVVVMDNVATGNDADQGGGGLYNQGGTMTLASVLVRGNMATGTSGSGGGLLNNDGTLTVNTSAFVENTANRAGGGIEDANAAMSTKGGGPDVTIDGSLFFQNDAGASPGNGGGMHVGGPGQIAITMSVFAENTAVEGAGFWNSGAGSASISTTTLIANEAMQGGGLYQSGTGGSLFVEQSLVAGNTATAGGGAQVEGGDVTIVNSTVSSNVAVRGGGIRQLGGTVSLASATIARNEATNRGGGLRIAAGTMNVQNTIIGENVSPQGRSCSGTIVSQDYNLIEDRGGCNITGDQANSQTNVMAMLEELADNGGPTRTHALMPGSPAIDAGQTVETVDQRGFLRDDGQDDMGAFELGATEPMETVATTGESAPTEAAPTAELPGESALVTMTEPVRLDAIAPNPLRAGANGTVTFAVRESETIEVALYDAMGRRVATVYNGAPQGSQLQTAALQTGDLAAGVYILRLSGETVQATRMVTLVR